MQRAFQVGEVPVVLTATASGVTALANTCRHRGHELLAGGCSTSGRALVCPYHGWSYRLDGSLLAAPGFDDDRPLDVALKTLPVERWHGWLFVNADAEGRPFAEHLGALDDVVGPYRPERLVRGALVEYEVRANWKLVHENFHECYHCPLIHPELCAVSPPDTGVNFDLPGEWVGGVMSLRDGAETMSLDGRSSGKQLFGPYDQRRHSVCYVGLLPNLLLSLHPDYVLAHRLASLAPDRTRIECTWYFPQPDIDPSYAVEFWDRTNRQDWAAIESVQRGLASPHYVPGPFSDREDAVHRLVTMIARRYLGDAVDAADAL
jgi:Rieske 2Fe-2S family protein